MQPGCRITVTAAGQRQYGRGTGLVTLRDTFSKIAMQRSLEAGKKARRFATMKILVKIKLSEAYEH
ncbi:MAG: hypothetical protein DMG24_20465 [Acidobacteria bacterium]|nr:MAG: hypothetical protein DMG24_20465 [Acidobacteriota bacterium]